MRQIIVAHIENEDKHHDYIYKEGKKIPKEDNGQRYLCINEIGELHAYKWPDEASYYGNDVFMATDEIGVENGYPTVGDEKYRICGAGEDYVYLNTDRKEKYHTKNVVTDTKVVVASPSNTDKKADCELLRQIYVELENVMKENGKWGDRP